MSTEKQAKANRNNSLKSTGPQTAAGKAAVSQNALKHGLFAADAVISGEDPAGYDDFHEKFLADLAPVGMAESVLAERIVSLSWRLRRAVRMQNQSIDVMIAQFETDSWNRTQRERTVNAQDPRAGGLELLLGWATKNDFSNSHVLDRLLLYERRIENSMVRMMKELKRFQVIRQLQHAETRSQEPCRTITKAYGIKDASYYRPEVKMDDLKKQSQFNRSALGVQSTARTNLKKQSQFAPELMGTTSFMQGAYDDNPAGVNEENKPNQSQSRAAEPDSVFEFEEQRLKHK